jgi:sugar transferase (PEP-CTERM/EpsH1 system associated)
MAHVKKYPNASITLETYSVRRALRLLYLCQRIPFPPDRGDRIAAFHQIKHLVAKHEIIVGSLIQEGRHAHHAGLRRELGVQVIAPYNSQLRRARCLSIALARGRPLSLGYFESPRLQLAVNEELSRKGFDAVIVFSSSMAQYVEDCKSIPRIMHFCDLDSQKWDSLAQRSRGLKRWIYQREASLLLEYERKIAASFEASCVVSKREADLFRRLIPGVPVSVVENGVDIGFFSEVPRQPADIRVVFMGVMDYAPNVEAVTFLANNIWRGLHAVFPHARFVIVGSKPTRKVRNLARIPSIEVTGYVSDVRPYLASATISVVPLAIARGVQNKVLEAMAAGVPVLTTREVAKGLPAGAEQHVFVAERTKAFGAVLVELLRNPVALEQMGKSAQEFVQNNCTWDAKLRALDELLEQLTHRTVD